MSPFDPEKTDLEEELRSGRPRAPRGFLATLAATAAPARSGFRGRRPLTVALVGAASLAVMGGIGFAASSAIESSNVAVKRVADAGARSISIRNAAQEQYVEETAVVVDGAPKVTTGTSQSNGVGTKGKDTTFILRGSITTNESGMLFVQVLANDDPVDLKASESTARDQRFGSYQGKTLDLYIQRPGRIDVKVTVFGNDVKVNDRLSLVLRFQDFEDKVTPITIPATAPICTLVTSKTTSTVRVNKTLKLKGTADAWCTGLKLRATSTFESTVAEPLGRFVMTGKFKKAGKYTVTIKSASSTTPATPVSITVRVKK